MRVFPDFLRKIRKRMAPWGVTIPLFDPPSALSRVTEAELRVVLDSAIDALPDEHRCGTWKASRTPRSPRG